MRRLYEYTMEEFEQMLAQGPIVMVCEEMDPNDVLKDVEYVITLFIGERQGKQQYIFREDWPNGSWGETWGDTLLQVFLTKVFHSEFDTCIVREADRLPLLIKQSE